MSVPAPALARRLARAVLDVATEQGRETAARLKSELAALAEVSAGHAELRAVLEDPRVKPPARRAVVEALAQKMGLHALAQKLAVLLAERDELAVVPALARAYAVEWNARAGIVPARAISAVPLEASQEKALAAALSRVSGREVELQTMVDPEVIGGLRVRLGDTLYDGTVRAHLLALQKRLAGGR